MKLQNGSLPDSEGFTASLSLLLANILAPAFQRLFHKRHELVGDGAIDDAMVVAEGQVHNRADGNRVSAVFVGDDERHFGDATDAHDCRVRLIDNRQAEYRSELAGIG